MRRRLVWQLFPTFVLVLLVAFVGTALFLTHTTRHFYLKQKKEQIRSHALVARALFKERLFSTDSTAFDAQVKMLGRQTGIRYTVIAPDGEVLADSERQLEVLDNHAQRPEVAEALAGKPALSERYSQTLQQALYYYALPAMGDGKTVAVVRLALPLTEVERALAELRHKLLYGFLGGLLLAALVSRWSSRRLSRPLEAMQQGARRYAEGHFEQKLPAEGARETADLALSLNRMAQQLDHRLKTVIEQRNAQDAMLSSMVEGVLAVDNEERILRINRAAIRLLGLEGKNLEGMSLQEVVRKTDVQAFIAKTLASTEPLQGDMTLQTLEGELHLQANGTLLMDAEDRRIGALVVFNDVTDLRRLERVRRDFVANVSHELKTPVTAIKGVIETLLNDEVALEREEAKAFLQRSAAQADRLSAIIDDLLDLSRIEQGISIPLEAAPLLSAVRSAAQVWQLKAQKYKVNVTIAVPDDLCALINAPLLEQALINLVDNALKSSEKGTEIRVEASSAGNKVLLSVVDQGCGIEAKHLPRIFERFYRVDKARSRKEGGTGLGLAIVKHIAQAHQGSVTVLSQPGEGTRFTLTLLKSSP